MTEIDSIHATLRALPDRMDVVQAMLQIAQEKLARIGGAPDTRVALRRGELDPEILAMLRAWGLEVVSQQLVNRGTEVLLKPATEPRLGIVRLFDQAGGPATLAFSSDAPIRARLFVLTKRSSGSAQFTVSAFRDEATAADVFIFVLRELRIAWLLTAHELRYFYNDVGEATEGPADADTPHIARSRRFKNAMHIWFTSSRQCDWSINERLCHFKDDVAVDSSLPWQLQERHLSVRANTPP